jgi:hypothetical protein
MSLVIKVITLATICLIVTVIAQVGSCRSSNANTTVTTSTKNEKLPTGIWGGEHINADVTETGVEIEFDCAHGSIPTGVVLDAQGRFNVRGKFTAERGGPVQRDETSTDRAVQYAGAVKGKEMTLTISDSNTKEVIDTFTLRHGSEGRIRKCR